MKHWAYNMNQTRQWAALSLVIAALGQAAVADNRAQLSCGAFPAGQDAPTYVTLDAPGYPGVEAALNALQQGDPFENAIPLKAIGDFMQMGLADLTLPLLAASCGYDMFAANECAGNRFFPSTVTQATLSGTALAFTTQPDDDTTIEVQISNPDFDLAKVANIQGADNEVSIWTRQADGTETYLSEASNGDTTAYTERPDCSGKGQLIRHNQNGLLTTNSFYWTAAEDSFSFHYKICDHQGDDAGCHEGQLN